MNAGRAELSLPPGWTRTTIGAVTVKKVPQTGPSSKTKSFRYVDISSIDNSSKSIRDAKIVSVTDAPSRAKQQMAAGDVLVSMTRPNLNAVGFVSKEFDGAIASTGFDVLRSLPTVESKWLFMVVQSAAFIDAMSDRVQGALYPAVRPRDVRGYEIPLPPVAEQRRIAAKVETILGQVNAARDRLAKVPNILKRFRQSTLAEVLRGEERALGEVLIDLKYGTSKKCEPVKRGVPVLRIPNVSKGVVDHTDLKYAELDDKERNATQLRPGDLLMIRSNGSVTLLGRTALVTEHERGFSYAGYLMRLRLDPTKIAPKYAYLALLGHSCRDQIEMPARSTSGVNNINSDEVRRLRLPLPSLPAQHEIVRRVEALFALADKIEARVAAASARAEKLIQSTLAKAFRGELVPTEHALQQMIQGQQMANGMAVLQVLALLYTWKASPDRRTFELGMILIQHDVLRARVLKADRVSTVWTIGTKAPNVGSLDELVAELVGTDTLQLEQRKVSQLVKLGATAPSKDSLLGTSVGQEVFAQAKEAVRAVESLKQLGQSLDQYATAEEYDAIEIAIS